MGVDLVFRSSRSSSGDVQYLAAGQFIRRLQVVLGNNPGWIDIAIGARDGENRFSGNHSMGGGMRSERTWTVFVGPEGVLG